MIFHKIQSYFNYYLMSSYHFLTRLVITGIFLLVGIFTMEATEAASATTPPLEITAACLLSSSAKTELYENGSYVLSSLTSSHQTLWWQTKGSCVSVCDRTINSFPNRLMKCFWNGNIMKEYGGIEPNPQEFIVKNCSIPVGKSTCHTGVYVKWPAGNMYSLDNITRSISSANIITPNNYNSTTGMYFLDPTKTPSLGDTANVLKYGMNTLKLRLSTPGTFVAWTISSTTAEWSCVLGSTWNGQICVADKVVCTMEARMCEDGSVMPRNPNTCEWLPGQCKPINPLTITCSKSSYMVWEEVACKISGGIGVKMCWQKGTKDTSPVECTKAGWDEDGLLYYYKIITPDMVGSYIFSVKDESWKIATTAVKYIGEPPYMEFITENCTIPVGQSSCTSTFYLVNPGSGKSYDVRNVTRNITSKNFFTPNSIGTLPGANYPVYKVSTALSTSSANVAKYGTNSLLLLDTTGINLKTSTLVASCATGSTWNGQICAPKSNPPIACTMEMRYCENGDAMPRNPDTCEWLPGQCTPNYPVTSIILNDIIINDTVLDYTWGTITITEKDTLSLKWMSRPGAVIYFAREWQTSYETIGVSSTTGEWSIKNIWNPAWAKIGTPGEYTYKITWVPPNIQSLIYSPEVVIRIKIAPNSSNTNVLFEAKNCIIPIGKSTCPSLVSVTSTKYKGTTGGRTFDLKNYTRGVNSVSLFTPNSTTINSDGYPVYTVGANSTGDAANYATRWSNDLALIEWDVVVAKTNMTATCAAGSQWNGQICSELRSSPTQSGWIITNTWGVTARMTNCVIPEWKNTCPSTVLIFAQSGKTFSMNNVTRSVNSPDIIKPEHYRILQGRSVYVYRGINSPNYANNLAYGVNTITITEKGMATIGTTVKATASCATGKKWDGTKCASLAPATFSVATYQTAQWEKPVSGGNITFNPVEDKTLILKGVWPYGAIEVLEWPDGRVLQRISSSDTSGKWQITITPSLLVSQRTTSLIIWDGKNTATQLRISITNQTYSEPGTAWSIDPGILTTKLVDLN